VRDDDVFVWLVGIRTGGKRNGPNGEKAKRRQKQCMPKSIAADGLRAVEARTVHGRCSNLFVPRVTNVEGIQA
jgi:hypothetical protein